MTIGPSLPPHLAKRSRDDEDNTGSRSSSSPDNSDKRRRVVGPALPPPSNSSPPHVAGPSLPPHPASRSSSPDSYTGPAPPPASSKPPARVLGPAPPPAPLDERPSNPPSEDDSDSSSDDDFGPAPPPPGTSYNSLENCEPTAKSAFDTEPQYVEAEKKVQRDDWMTLPPTHDGLSRIDPTKMRARKFNTGKNASTGSTGDGMGIWTETPEQKLKRLQDEAMGISAPANTSSSKKESRRSRDEEERSRRRRDQIEADRGLSLIAQHKEKEKLVKDKEPEDDPSKRAFNYDKDMAVSGKLSHKQKREMLNKAKGFGDRFSGGSFL